MSTLEHTTAQQKLNSAGFARFFSIEDRPAANMFGVGQCQIGDIIYISNGIVWSMLQSADLQLITDSLLTQRLDSVSESLERTTYSTISGSGTLNGQLLDSGQSWVASGTGQATTAIVDDHIEGSQNTYCFVDTGKPIKRVTQVVSGHVATIACLLVPNSLDNMVHMNFIGGTSPAVLYWKTAVATAAVPTWSQVISAVPTMSDGSVHTFTTDFVGNYVFAYADGALIYIAYHPNFSSVLGTSFFAQIHDATSGNESADDKIYSVEAYRSFAETDINKSNLDTINVKTKSIITNSIQVGNPTKANYSPISPSYFHTDHANGHVFGGDLNPTINVKATTEGTGARLRLSPTASTSYQFEILAQGDATAIIKHSANTRLSFPPNVNTVSIPGATVVGGGTVNANAILDVQSTTKAFMPPRMTTVQKSAIASPTAGMVVYDSDLAKLCVYTTTWETITSA